MVSTREEVISTVGEAWADLTRARLDNPLVAAQLQLEENLDDEEIYQMLVKITSYKGKLEDYINSHEPGELATIKDTESLAALRAKTIHFQERGPCVGRWHAEAAASVTKLNMSGEVCVSISKLEVMPTASLRFDVLALLIHEMAHLNGYDEVQAQKIQLYFLKNITRLLRADGSATRERLFARYDDLVTRCWGYLVRYDNIDQDYINQTVIIWGTSLNAIRREILDPYASLDHPAHPELYNEFSKSVKSAESLSIFRYWSDHKSLLSSSVAVTPEALADMREAILSALQSERVLAMYFFGEKSERKGFNKTLQETYQRIVDEEKKAVQFTDPSTLSHPELQLKKGFVERTLFGQRRKNLMEDLGLWLF